MKMIEDKDRQGWTAEEEMNAFVDARDEVIFCPKCHCTNLTVIVHHEEFKTWETDKWIKLTHDIDCYCPRCGFDMINGWFLEDYIPKEREDDSV